MSEQYGALAEIYDALMYDVSYADWKNYLVGLLNTQAVPSDAYLLEYACGTGNLTIPLAKEGFGITAVDIAEDMLFFAQEKSRKQALAIDYVCADMRDFKLNKPADAALCACDGVNYLLKEEDALVFFQKVYGNLKEDGIFLFDISSAYKIKEILGNEFYYDDGDRQTYFWQNSYDDRTKTVTMELALFLAQGEVYKRYDEIHKQRAWEQEQLIGLLEKAGFQWIEVYDFMTVDCPVKKSERLQFMAGKERKK